MEGRSNERVGNGWIIDKYVLSQVAAQKRLYARPKYSVQFTVISGRLKTKCEKLLTNSSFSVMQQRNIERTLKVSNQTEQCA